MEPFISNRPAKKAAAKRKPDSAMEAWWNRSFGNTPLAVNRARTTPKKIKAPSFDEQRRRMGLPTKASVAKYGKGTQISGDDNAARITKGSGAPKAKPKPHTPSKAARDNTVRLIQHTAPPKPAHKTTPKSTARTVHHSPTATHHPVAKHKKPTKGAPHTTPKPGTSTKKPTTAAPKAAKEKSLSQYVSDAQKLLGPGTDYKGLTKQLRGDTSKADSNISAMYQAYGRDVKGTDDTLKKIYADTAADDRATSAQSTKSVNDAYGNARNDVSSQLSRLGIAKDAAKNLAANGNLAQGDQVNRTSDMATRLASALHANSANAAASRTAQAQVGDAVQAGAVETRGDLQQSLADSLAKLHTQQSTEDASRRTQAVTFGQQQQSSDRSMAAAQAAAQAAAEKQAFNEQLGMANFGLATRKQSFNEGATTKSLNIKQGSLNASIANNAAKNGIAQQNANNTAAHNAAHDTQAAINEKDRLAIAKGTLTTSLAKLAQGKTNSLLNRQNAARTAGVSAGLTDSQMTALLKTVR